MVGSGELPALRPRLAQTIAWLRASIVRTGRKRLREIEDKAQQLNAEIERPLLERGLPPTQWKILPNEHL